MTSDIKSSNNWHWWMFLLRGLLFIFVGIYMLATPVKSYAALSFLFGIIILLAGIAELMHAYANRHTGRWGWHLLLGIVDFVLGVILVANLSFSMSVLPFVLGIWFLSKAFSLFGFASVLQRPAWMIAGGIAMTLFALLVIFNPAVGAMTIVIWTALAFVVTGIFNLLLAFGLRSVHLQ